MIYILKNENTKKESVQYLISEVQKAGGIDYANEKMFNYFSEKSPKNVCDAKIYTKTSFKTARPEIYEKTCFEVILIS